MLWICTMSGRLRTARQVDRNEWYTASKPFIFVDGRSMKVMLGEHYEVHYIILRASKEETLKRAVERSKLDRKTNIELVETMWEQFYNLGIYESNVVVRTNYSIQETVAAVQEKIASRAELLS